MSQKLHLECVHCGRVRCNNCQGEKIPLCRNPKKDKHSTCTNNNEALQGSASHGFELLHSTTHTSAISRAASLPPEEAIEAQSPLRQLSFTEGTLTDIPEFAALIHLDQDRADPISTRFQQETSGLGQAYEGERSPRSNEEDEKDTFDFGAFDRDTNSFFGPVLFPDSERLGGAVSWSQYESGNDKIETCGTGEGQRAKTGSAEGFDPDGIDPFEGLNLDPAYNSDTYSVEPQISVPIFASDINTIDPAQFPNAYPFPAPWTGYNIGHTELPMPSFPYESSDLAMNGIPNTAPQLPDMESLIDQKEEFHCPRSPPHHNGDDRQLGANKRQLHQGNREGSPDRACESCSLTASIDENTPLACLFYKRNPARYPNCIKKTFKSIGHLRQHLNHDHKLGVYHCKNCWESFADQESLDAHVMCEPTHGSSVDDLGRITKTRRTFNNKWYWTWRKLFGRGTAPPKCPYSHPTRDMASHLFSQFLQHLTAQGTNLDVRGFEEAISQWLASYHEPSNDTR
ncbi:hypothetical protein F5Y00DRAFT_270245 [Daldinia vernicosa]|uniref:uncharacterized protein n=1 Tax=Daldinia vernicosa TaxID=114800 RepID=UPI0020083DEF|nr:uncharacterized protein F5Y00DRAFT_270245 [Daldinia vernicosa]KAI0848271.1 hypothetical protein F5Y00DRAFT_270245 [Daldinia vernicosa]